MILDELQALFALLDPGEPRRVDSCRPMGIPFDRSLCPPDNEMTDRLAAARSWAPLPCPGRTVLL